MAAEAAGGKTKMSSTFEPQKQCSFDREREIAVIIHTSDREAR